MLASIFAGHCDSYHQDSSHRLVNSIRSFLSAKLEYERKTPEFVAEVRRLLYFVHEYNTQVTKVTHQYPRSRKLDLLLIKYVELEYDALYCNNPRPSQELEIITELRVLRLLQVMLYQAVLNNETLITKNTDQVLKKAVLQLLSEVKSTYLVDNKLVCNIVNKLLRKIDNPNDCFNVRNLSLWDAHKNLATSDYGTEDSDSDLENDILSRNKEIKQKRNHSDSDCIEVSLTNDDVSSIPTVEFVDDGDSYFVYLQKRIQEKVKHKRVTFNKGSNNLNVSSLVSSKNKSITGALAKNHKNRDPVCVDLCSDSEDEVPSNSNKTSKKRNLDKNTNQSNKKAKTDKPVGVVTFEILDDDDDGGANYMVYLQKEVVTNKRTKQSDVNEIVISDSEDELKEEVDVQTKIEETVPFVETGTPTRCRKNSSPSFLSENSVDIKPDPSEASSQDSSEDPTDIKPYPEIENEECLQTPSTSSENSFLDSLDIKPEGSPLQQTNEIFGSPSNTSEEHRQLISLVGETNENFLVSPAVIFDQAPSASVQLRNILDPTINFVGDNSGPNVLGGPVLTERINNYDDLDNFHECRINESLLEEILFDDSYLLEGRKEFEELEYFLFNDSAERQGLYFDENETVCPETFDADVKSLEALLDTSKLFTLTSENKDMNCDTSRFSENLETMSGSRNCRNVCRQSMKNIDRR